MELAITSLQDVYGVMVYGLAMLCPEINLEDMSKSSKDPASMPAQIAADVALSLVCVTEEYRLILVGRGGPGINYAFLAPALGFSFSLTPVCRASSSHTTRKCI